MNEQIKKDLKASLDIRGHQSYRSEMGQDEWVMQKTGNKRDGFFVDCGAAHPYIISNTWRLEQELGWSGILVEPNDLFWALLEEHRKATLVKKAVSNERGTLKMRRETLGSSLLKNSDRFNPTGNSELVDVECDLLVNILDELNAPKVIDYLNLDIPGAELDVISSFDFDKYDVRLITVKDNQSEKYTEILQAKGFTFEGNVGIDRAFSKRDLPPESKPDEGNGVRQPDVYVATKRAQRVQSRRS
jgi:FkbM family methyltransferase